MKITITSLLLLASTFCIHAKNSEQGVTIEYKNDHGKIIYDSRLLTVLQKATMEPTEDGKYLVPKPVENEYYVMEAEGDERSFFSYRRDVTLPCSFHKLDAEPGSDEASAQGGELPVFDDSCTVTYLAHYEGIVLNFSDGSSARIVPTIRIDNSPIYVIPTPAENRQ